MCRICSVSDGCFVADPHQAGRAEQNALQLSQAGGHCAQDSEASEEGGQGQRRAQWRSVAGSGGAAFEAHAGPALALTRQGRRARSSARGPPRRG